MFALKRSDSSTSELKRIRLLKLDLVDPGSQRFHKSNFMKAYYESHERLVK